MKLIFLLLVFVASFIPCSAQDEKKQPQKILTVCPFQLINKMADFRFQFSYVLEADTRGKVTKIEELYSTQKYKKYKFVRDDLFLDCMKKWRLEPAGKYFVAFYVGTTSNGITKDMPFNYMRITDPNKQTLIIDLEYPTGNK